MTAQDVAILTNSATVFTDDILAGITSFEGALKTFESAGVEVESSSDYGTGFNVVEKKTLVGVDLLVLEWRFNPSELSDEGFFASVTAVTKNGDKVIFNDGSGKSGIFAQLKTITSRRHAENHQTPQCGLMVAGGLTVSSYMFDAPDGTKKPASTYYLSE